MQLAKRISDLGTETAFAVAAEAKAHAAKGHKVYPFHLGDMNIPTPENIVQATFKAVRDGKTGYCPNHGVAELRELLAEDINRSHGTHYRMENVCIQPGGKPVIGKFLLALMNPGDEVLYPSPGYPIYESLIEFFGGKAVPYSWSEGADRFELDPRRLADAVTQRTRLLVLNDMHNPTGADCSEGELADIAELARKHNLFVLCDEAYFAIRYAGKSLSLASFPGMEERCVILYTFSKKYAMTGWRLGAAIGPKPLIEVIAKLSLNDESCSNHFIQYGAIEALTNGDESARQIVRTLRERRDKAVELLRSIDGVKCFEPRTTFYLFPNVTEAMSKLGVEDYEAFRRRVLERTGVSFCTRTHFCRPLPGESEKYIRLAYSGVNVEDIEKGLAELKKFLG